MVGWLFALLSYHSWVLFSSLTVTYVLYLNNPREGIPKAREGIPKASTGIALVCSQQAAVPIMGFWP